MTQEAKQRALEWFNEVMPQYFVGERTKPEYIETIRECLSQPATPEGWKLVPIEPTEEMISAAINRENEEPTMWTGIYKAMLAAVESTNEKK